MKYRYRFSLVLAACLLLIAPIVVAQTTGNIDGTVTDQSGGVLPGVTVELSSPALQGTRSATTAADGRYRFVALPPGNYRVTAALSGFGPVQKNATVQLDSTATVNLQMQLAAAEKITVTGEAPIVDVTSTTTGTNYTAQVMNRLPVGRNYAEIVRSQPGVQSDSGETQGRGLALSIYGATSAENLYLIDGVNTTNVIKGFQGKALNPEFIQEVEVKTGGYQAEYGRNTGGVINVITKSGGNEFHGDVFGYYNTDSMRADIERSVTSDYSQRGDTNVGSFFDKDERQEYGVDLGGFFIKDRIWFFGAYSRVEQDLGLVPLDGPRRGEEFPREDTTNLGAGKLTFNIFQGTTFVATYFTDPTVQEGALVTPRSTNPNTFNARRDVGGSDYAGRLNQLFGSFGILTLQYARHTDRFNTKPFARDVVQFRDRTLSPFVAFGGFGSVFGPTINNASERDQYSGSFTAYFGNQEIKVGADYQDDVTFGSTFYTGGQRVDIRPCTQTGTSICDLTKAPFHTNRAGVTRQVFYQHAVFTASGTNLTPLASAPFETPTLRTGAFIQDTWRIIPTLTVNAGVRWDTEDIRNGLDETAFKLEDQWAHRFGFTWDFIGDGSSKLYGSAGRFYYSLPTDLNVRVFTANTQLVSFNYDPNNATLQDPTAPRNRLVQVGSFEGEPVDPGTKAAYQDEYTIGVEKALDPTLSLGLKGTYRTLGRTVEDRCDLDYTSPLTQFNSCALFNPGGSGPAARGDLPGANGSANPTDPQGGQHGVDIPPIGDAKRIFRGVELVARKALSERLWAQASYLYSTLRGNYSGAIRVASGQTDPGINADYDYNQFLINAYGDLELDRPHQFRLDTVWNAPFGLAVGLQAYVRSGVPTSRLGFYNNFYPDLLYLDKRGSNGRTPTEYETNLSLAYNINIGPVTVTPQLYIFNLLDRQIVTDMDQDFNINSSFVTAGPFRGQGGVQPGTPRPIPPNPICTDPTPCSDNPDYRKATSRTNPRLFRAALKISF